MKLEKMDWERVRDEAKTQLRQAELMRVVNEVVLMTAEKAIYEMNMIEEHNNTTANTATSDDGAKKSI